jgi:hypothetical protein
MLSQKAAFAVGFEVSLLLEQVMNFSPDNSFLFSRPDEESHKIHLAHSIHRG